MNEIQKHLHRLANSTKVEAEAKEAIKAMLAELSESEDYKKLNDIIASSSKASKETKAKLEELALSDFDKNKNKKIEGSLGIRTSTYFTPMEDKSTLRKWVEEHAPYLLELDPVLAMTSGQKDQEKIREWVEKNAPFLLTIDFLGLKELTQGTLSINNWFVANMPNLLSTNEQNLIDEAKKKDSEIPDNIVKVTETNKVTFAKDLSKWEGSTE